MSETLPDDGRMKPILIVPPDVLDEQGLKDLRDNGLCVVVCKDPAAVRFLDPIPAMVGRTAIEEAAIGLSRKVLDPTTFGGTEELMRGDLYRWWARTLVIGTRLDPSFVASPPPAAKKSKTK